MKKFSKLSPLLMLLFIALACGYNVEQTDSISNDTRTSWEGEDETQISLSSADRIAKGELDCDDSSQCTNGFKCINKKTGDEESFEKSVPGSEVCKLQNGSVRPTSAKSESYQSRYPLSRFQVEIDGSWENIACLSEGATFAKSARWVEHERILIDIDNKRALDCPEGRLETCECKAIPTTLFDKVLTKLNSVDAKELRKYGEALHGHHDGPVSSSITLDDGDAIFPDIKRPNCLYINGRDLISVRKTDGSRSKTKRWSDSKCSYFRFDNI